MVSCRWQPLLCPTHIYSRITNQPRVGWVSGHIYQHICLVHSICVAEKCRALQLVVEPLRVSGAKSYSFSDLRLSLDFIALLKRCETIVVQYACLWFYC